MNAGAITGRAHPDDVARLKADFREFYDDGLGKLADAAIQWIASGDDFEKLQQETEKARALAIEKETEWGPVNKLDRVLRGWQEHTLSSKRRPARDAFFVEPARYEPKCMWRFASLVNSGIWMTGQPSKHHIPIHPDQERKRRVSEALVTIGSAHWAKSNAYPPLWMQDDIAEGETPGPFPALRLYVERRDMNTVYSIVKTANAADYLTKNAPEICASFKYSDLLAGALAQLKVVHHGYTDWVIKGIIPDKLAGPTAYKAHKPVKDGAVHTLAAIPETRLISELRTHFLDSDVAIARPLVDVIALRGGAEGRELLRQRLASEKNSGLREAIERVLRTEQEELADSENGYVALDGSWVDIPPVPEIEPEFPVPDSFHAEVDRCRQNHNKVIAQRNEQSLHYHKERIAAGDTRFPHPNVTPAFPIEWVDEIVRRAKEGRPPQAQQHEFHVKGLYKLTTRPYSYDKVKPWSARALHLYHLLRITYSDQLHSYAGPWANDIAELEVRRRLGATLDVRTLRDALRAIGREPRPLPLGDYSYLPAPNVWPHFAEHMEPIAEGFAKGDEQAAMDTLRLFSKIPKRFAPALINLALSEKRKQSAPAQALLGAEPSLTPLILPQLASKSADRRRVAATWLGKRGDPAVIEPLHAAAKKEKSTPVYAAILNALKALGADLSAYFDEATLLEAAEESLAKKDPDKKTWFPLGAMPDLFWADGRPLKRALIRHWLLIADDLQLAAGNAQIDLYLDQLHPESASTFGLFVLKAWLAHDTVPISEEQLAAIGVEIWKEYQRYPDAVGCYVDNSTYVVWRDLDEVTPGACVGLARKYLGGRLVNSAYDNRGILAIAARAPAGEITHLIAPYLKEHYKRMGQCKVLLDCLAANGAPAALQLIFATATKSKNKGVQKHASALVDMLAEARGWTRDELADRTAPTAGLDEIGALELPIGDNTYTARLAQDLTLDLRNPAGAKVTALPAPKDEALAEQAKEAKAALSAAKKELKQTVELQSMRFYEALCAERVWRAEDFSAFILKHPIVSRLAERLIWIALDANGKTLAAFRPMGDGTLTDAQDEPVSIDAAASVKLAHLAGIGADEAEAWLRHFKDYELTPLFPQLTRQRRTLTPELADAETLEDRQGWVMDTFKLRSAATKLGWKRGPIIDGGSFESYEKALPGLGLTAVLSFTGSMVPETNMQAALFGVQITRPSADGPTPIALADAPPGLLSEVWNDYHDIAAAGAFDPNWENVSPW